MTTAGRDDDKLTTEGQPRHHRRLTKWPKTSDVTGSDGNLLPDQDEGSLLYQSLKAMETHLLEKPEDELLESSSEKDVYLQDGGNGVPSGGSGESGSSSDESDDTQEEDEDKANNFVTDIQTGGGGDEDDTTKEKMDVHMNKLQQLKHAHQMQKTTTPKGLTTWSAVGSGGVVAQPPRGTVQKVSMSDFTISSALAFTTQSTIKPITTADIVTRDRTEVPPTTTDLPTTMVPETYRPVTIMPTRPRKRPNIHHSKKPTKHVKPPLDEVTATVIGSDETHNIYVLKPVDDPETKTATPDLMASYTKQPWPFMTTKKAPFMKIRTTARPIKNAYAKRTQTPKLSLTTPTTIKPQTTTVYYRNPTTGFVHPIIPLSFTNLSFMDFFRTQVVPKIGLSMISFIATSPLILTMLGAVGRKKRDLSEVTGKSTSAQDWKFSEYLESLATKWERQLNSSTESSSIYNGYQSADSKPKKRNKLKNNNYSSGKY